MFAGTLCPPSAFKVMLLLFTWSHGHGIIQFLLLAFLFFLLLFISILSLLPLISSSSSFILKLTSFSIEKSPPNHANILFLFRNFYWIKNSLLIYSNQSCHDHGREWCKFFAHLPTIFRSKWKASPLLEFLFIIDVDSRYLIFPNIVAGDYI